MICGVLNNALIGSLLAKLSAQLLNSFLAWDTGQLDRVFKQQREIHLSVDNKAYCFIGLLLPLNSCGGATFENRVSRCANSQTDANSLLEDQNDGSQDQYRDKRRSATLNCSQTKVELWCLKNQFNSWLLMKDCGRLFNPSNLKSERPKLNYVCVCALRWLLMSTAFVCKRHRSVSVSRACGRHPVSWALRFKLLDAHAKRVSTSVKHPSDGFCAHIMSWFDLLVDIPWRRSSCWTLVNRVLFFLSQ